MTTFREADRKQGVNHRAANRPVVNHLVVNRLVAGIPARVPTTKARLVS